MKMLMALSTVLLISLRSEMVFAQLDPDYQIEVQENTQCSFINANNVNIRQEPNIQSPVIAQLNRGDGVRVLGSQGTGARVGNWVKLAARDSGQPPTPFSPLQGYVFNQYINGCSEDQFDRWRR